MIVWTERAADGAGDGGRLSEASRFGRCRRIISSPLVVFAS